MKVSISKKEDVLVVSLNGILDDKSISYVEHELYKQMKDFKKIIINMRETEAVTLSALYFILTTAKLLATVDGFIKLCAVKQDINTMLESSGFNKIIPVYNSIEDALYSAMNRTNSV